ncbi:MAG: hypothetical protein ISS33_06620 [Candidatus Omnitrophica bacterium]|nr:hypothetical protein [Candidatus Omnitrophota bacterium]
MFRKITTIAILSCFLLNTLLSGNAFSREIQNDTAATLATASGHTGLIGIMHQDIVRIKRTIEYNLRTGDTQKRKTKDNTPGQEHDITIYYPEKVEKPDGVYVKCRFYDEKHGIRTYIAKYSSTPSEDTGFSVKVYSEYQYKYDQEIPQEDQDIRDRYEQHEEYDEHVIKWAHDEAEKGNLTIVERDISKDVDKIQKTANILIDDSENPIRERKCYLVPLTEEAEKRIQKYKTTVIDINGNKIEVPTYAHSSNHAIHIFMDQSVINLIVENNPSNPNTQVAINYFRYTLAYEMGPMVGQRPQPAKIQAKKNIEFVFSGASLFGHTWNEISYRFYDKAMNGISLSDTSRHYKTVDLDTNLADRDYAMWSIASDVNKLRTILETLIKDFSPWTDEPKGLEILIEQQKAKIVVLLLRITSLEDVLLIKEIVENETLWNSFFLTLGTLDLFLYDSEFSKSLHKNLDQATQIAQKVSESVKASTPIPLPWDPPNLSHVGRDRNASLLPKLVKGTPLTPPLTPEKNKATYNTIAKALIAALSQNAISLAKKVGIKIARPVSDYTVFTLPGLYKKGEFAKDQGKFKARFNLEQLEADNPVTIAKNIDAAIKKGTLPQNIVVQLPETMDKTDITPLNALASKGVRFITVRTEGLTDITNKTKRLKYRKNVYSILLLGRNITGEDITNQTIQYQLFRIFLKSLLDENITDRDQAVTAYINNLTTNQLQDVVNTILLWRKPEKVAAPDPEILSKTLMSA